MTKPRQFFYCAKGCGRRPIDQAAEELDGVRLCRECRDSGFWLQRGVVVKRLGMHHKTPR